MSTTLKFTSEFVGIVKGAVVNEGNFAGTVEVRVGVLVSLASMGGPTGVCDTDVMALGGDGTFFDEFETIGVFSYRGVLCDGL